MSVLNFIQTDEYIITIDQNTFCMNVYHLDGNNQRVAYPVVYTSMYVAMTSFAGTKLKGTVEILSESVPNDDPAAVMALYKKAWKKFMSACDFCSVSPVSDSTFAVA